MATPIDLRKQRFGRLTVITQAPRRKGRVYWACLCDCGNLIDSVQTASLRNGTTKSCGCLARELASMRAKAGVPWGGVRAREVAAQQQAAIMPT
jgi:hypothetical protein